MLQNAKEEFFRHKGRYSAILAIALIAIVVGGFYLSGYRFGNNLALGKEGYVEMLIEKPLTFIYVDEEDKITTEKDNELVKLSFSPKEHSIIVARDGYYPWKKDFSIESGETLTLSPILVSINTSGQIITKNDPDYARIRNMIITDPLPTPGKPKISKDNTANLWLEDRGIIAQVGSERVSVLQTDTAIRNIDFYKGRSDAVIFSTSNAIYVIEIDEEGQQNFMPIYKGQKPSFIAPDPNFIYVLDGENLMQVII